jgi:hypothetical protein
MTRRRLQKAVFACVLVAGALLGAGMAMFWFPQPFFAWSVSSRNLTLYSDVPFSPDAGRRVLALAQAKLEASPLFTAGDHHAVFVCHARWRKDFFLNKSYRQGAGGVNFYPFTTNVFLRDALIEENRLTTTTGRRVMGDRTLDYFVAHEVAHTLTGRTRGWRGNFGMPVWVREGYADYVGKGGVLDFDAARRAFLAGARDMNPAASGLYRRYHLLVAYLLDRNGWTVRQVLETTVPQADVEAAVRDARPLPPR